ncbi:MAG TPA: hypothetical protein VIY49_39185 [Bryobacteraceae bacterium]
MSRINASEPRAQAGCGTAQVRPEASALPAALPSSMRLMTLRMALPDANG